MLPRAEPGFVTSMMLIVPSATLGLLFGIIVGTGRVFGPAWVCPYSI